MLGTGMQERDMECETYRCLPVSVCACVGAGLKVWYITRAIAHRRLVLHNLCMPSPCPYLRDLALVPVPLTLSVFLSSTLLPLLSLSLTPLLSLYSSSLSQRARPLDHYTWSFAGPIRYVLLVMSHLALRSTKMCFLGEKGAGESRAASVTPLIFGGKILPKNVTHYTTEARTDSQNNSFEGIIFRATVDVHRGGVV